MSEHDDDLARLSRPVTDRDHSAGPEDAPVTLVEYGDFECPHCGRAFPIVHALQERMGDTMRFVFRHFPLGEAHPHAVHAAEAAEAAAAQGKFWEMHSALFTHQTMLDDTHLVGHARRIGVDVERFTQELTAHTHAAHVREDFMSGVRSGVNGTPTFFINGVRFDDSWDLETLTGAVKAAAGQRRRRSE